MEGSFDNWTIRQKMQRSGKDFTIVKLLPPGVYQVLPCCTTLLLKICWARQTLGFRECHRSARLCPLRLYQRMLL